MTLLILTPDSRAFRLASLDNASLELLRFDPLEVNILSLEPLYLSFLDKVPPLLELEGLFYKLDPLSKRLRFINYSNIIIRAIISSRVFNTLAVLRISILSSLVSLKRKI